MPGYQLPKKGSSSEKKFSVVGKYARPDKDNFVRHVAILQEDCEVSFGSQTRVWHMKPPLVAGEKTGQASPPDFQDCIVHAVSYLENLNENDVAGIETALADMDGLTQRAQYCVHPAKEWIRMKLQK